MHTLGLCVLIFLVGFDCALVPLRYLNKRARRKLAEDLQMKHHDEIANAVQNAVDVGWNNALKHPPAVAQAYHKLFHGTDL